jgi:tetratricopeptide (TPR) repeat protein
MRVKPITLLCVVLSMGSLQAQYMAPSKPLDVSSTIVTPSTSINKNRFGNLAPVKAGILLQQENKKLEPIFKEVTFLGRQENMILMQGTQLGSVAIQLDKAKILRCEFDLDFDRLAVSTALQNNDWASAVRVMTPVIRSALPYLDVPDNNGLELAMELGLYMMNSAALELRNAADSNAVVRAHRQYEVAYAIFKSAGRADWSTDCRLAVLKGCRALLKQNKVEQAVVDFETVDEPDAEDVSFGHYWLVRGEIHFIKGQIREALEAACKSIVLANKDVETFPDALMLSAFCYNKLGRPHRARDVFYEVAVIFAGTDWSTDALAELIKIMDAKTTLEKEKSPLENVFFNVTEDMNKLATELIKARVKKEPPVKAPTPEAKK